MLFDENFISWKLDTIALWKWKVKTGLCLGGDVVTLEIFVGYNGVSI